MKSSFDTKKSLFLSASDKFGRYSVNDFIKKSLALSLSKPDFFFDVLTGVIDVFYDDSLPSFSVLADIRKLKR